MTMDAKLVDCTSKVVPWLGHQRDAAGIVADEALAKIVMTALDALAAAYASQPETELS